MGLRQESFLQNAFEFPHNSASVRRCLGFSFSTARIFTNVLHHPTLILFRAKIPQSIPRLDPQNILLRSTCVCTVHNLVKAPNKYSLAS